MLQLDVANSFNRFWPDLGQRAPILRNSSIYKNCGFIRIHGGSIFVDSLDWHICICFAYTYVE